MKQKLEQLIKMYEMRVAQDFDRMTELQLKGVTRTPHEEKTFLILSHDKILYEFIIRDLKDILEESK